MKNQILASIFSRFGYSLFTPSKFFRRIQSKSLFDDAGTRRTSKTSSGFKTPGTKRKTVPSEHQSY
nr:hypothetical protein [Flavobacterium sufflavum]